jgi:hypothetical protein
MKKIISAVSISCVLFSGFAFAKEKETGEKENFEHFKQKMIQHIDKEVAILTQLKTCVQAAQTPEAVETCRESQKATQKQLVLEMKKDRLERRKKLLEIQSKKIDEALKQEKK